MRIIFVVLLFTTLLSEKLCLAEKKDSLLTLCEEKIVKTPSDWETLDRYKSLCDSLDKLERGIDFLKGIIEKEKDIPELYTMLGLFYIARIPDVGDIEKGFLAGNALDEFNKAISIDSLNWSALYARGMLYLNMPPEFADYELALRDFLKLLSIQDKADSLEDYFALTYISLGDVYEKMKKRDKALKIWKEGLKLFPKNTELLKRLRL